MSLDNMIDLLATKVEAAKSKGEKTVQLDTLSAEEVKAEVERLELLRTAIQDRKLKLTICPQPVVETVTEPCKCTEADCGGRWMKPSLRAVSERLSLDQDTWNPCEKLLKDLEEASKDEERGLKEIQSKLEIFGMNDEWERLIENETKERKKCIELIKRRRAEVSLKTDEEIQKKEKSARKRREEKREREVTKRKRNRERQRSVDEKRDQIAQ